jgi:hypothetical protein
MFKGSLKKKEVSKIEGKIQASNDYYYYRVHPAITTSLLAHREKKLTRIPKEVGHRVHFRKRQGM